MTNEEIQKMMEFIIKQQEVFAENMDKAEKRMSRLESAFVGVFNLVNETAKLQKDLVEKHEKLADAQTHSDERLSALINVVEKVISSRNGN
jgi:hypothetical protein